MRIGLSAAALVALVVTLPSAFAGRAQQGPPRVCEGLTICGPVAGPWVVIPGPARGARTASSDWRIGCPHGGIVGGTDARVSDAWVQVSFAGHVGSPVNPGITTGREVLFTGVSVGPPGRPASYIPFVGCTPSQGGPRSPTGLGAVRQSRPGDAIVRRLRVLDLRARRVSGNVGCQASERMIGSGTATGIYTALKPTQAEIRGIRVTRSVAGRRIFVTAERVGLSALTGVDVQIYALCAGKLAR